MARDAKVFLIIGGRGSGKTFLLEKTLPKHETIVVELFKTARWSGYKKIFFSDIVNKKVNYKDLANSYVVFEDATSYISSNMTNEIKRLIVNSKQLGSDVFLVFHSINIVPPFLWYLWNYLILFKCAKPKYSAAIADNFNEIMQKWNVCNKAKPYHFEVIESQI